MAKGTAEINGTVLAWEASETDTWIEGSYRIKRRRDMKATLRGIRDATGWGCMVWKRSLTSQIREWRAHNLLHALGYERERTGSVDLDCEGPWRRVAYFILSCLYPHF